MPTSKKKLASTKIEANYDKTTAASKRLKVKYQKPTYGNPILALERKRMINSWVKAGQDLRRGLKPVEDAVRQELNLFNLREATHLTQKQISQVMREVTPRIRRATERAIAEMDQKLDVAMRRGIRANNAVFKEMGLKPLSKAEIAEIMASSKKATALPWPPKSPSTYEKRIQDAAKLHTAQLKQNLGKQYAKGKVGPAIMKNTFKGFRRVGVTGIRGGSYANRLQMILAAEQTRVTNEVAIQAMRVRGVEFAYWRLGPGHPWYGGGEICEWLAAVPYDGSMEELQAAGLATSDLDGLNAMSDWPDYPHPWCKCYPEPAGI
jgi:hypothetical protein